MEKACRSRQMLTYQVQPPVLLSWILTLLFPSHDTPGGKLLFSKQSTQEGLAIKTYQSDLFNNWVSTEWLDGENGINELTKVKVTDNSFTIDELNLSKKLYDMFMRIAVTGGTYDDWLDATYMHDRIRSVENPMYIGGLIKELVFQEVKAKAKQK